MRDASFDVALRCAVPLTPIAVRIISAVAGH